VTGQTPIITNQPAGSGVIIIGTIGRSHILDGLIRDKKINVSAISGKWESFLIQVVSKPLPGVSSALVIVGSDKRGTIYGVYDLSEQIGVSPWYWWADVPVQHKDALYVKAGKYVQGPPAVKYRGIFLNDEAPALTNWVKEKYGNYNHQFYEKVFELILRLKGNYLWPAMWNNAFNEDDPLNPKLADEYGIVMGTSHHEPMLRAQQEWKRHGEGPWDYSKNADVLQKFWTEGIERNKNYESIITLAMRGDGDMPMSEGANIELLEKIVASTSGSERKALTKKLKGEVGIPLCTTNRINAPDVAEQVLADGCADMVSMARPLLADADFVNKAAQNRADEINTCIACNQACLDFIFSDRTATCLVNPRACRETEFDEARRLPKRIAVIGSGPAGLAVASTAAARGHQVSLFEEHDELGGQIHLARRVPGKTEFNEMLRYFLRQIANAKVDVRLGVRATAGELAAGSFDKIVIATGILPRKPDIEGIDHPSVVSYLDVLLGRVEVGQRVAIIGTGGIGYDVAEFLTHADHGENAIADFLNEYGVDTTIAAPGGLKPAQPTKSPRHVTLFQRRQSRPGERLGVSTGWILRNRLRGRGVMAVAGANYEKIDDRGLHYVVDGEPRVFAADNIVICAGQLPNTELADELKRKGLDATCIGGAERAEELDALRAIQQGVRLAYDL